MILRIIGTYYLFTTIEYVSHRLGHYRSKINPIYFLHMEHHKKHYPITRLLSEKYQSQSEGIIAYSPVAALLFLSLYNLLAWETWMCVCIQLIAHAFINDTIHTQIHTKNSYLEKYDWFKKQRQIHFIHHTKLSKNYSFGIDSTMDKINNTYKS